MSNNPKLTDEQAAAAAAPFDRPTIVAAAAGSGKTTLLIERIMRLISDADNPVDAGTLAIMTFTVNATKAIREKLNSALQRRISELSDECSDEKKYLSEQIINLRSATISTINAFCLGIIRENFQKFSLPINFTIADDTKRTSMQQAAIRLASQDFYDENVFSDSERDTLFFSFSFENDSALFETVSETAEFLSSYGDSEKWLDEAADVYSSLDKLEEKYIAVYTNHLKKQLTRLRNAYEKSLNAVNIYGENIGSGLDVRKKKDTETLRKREEVLANMREYSDFDRKRLETAEADFAELVGNPSMDLLGKLLTDAKRMSDNTVTISRSDNINEAKKRFGAGKKAFQKIFSGITNLSVERAEEQSILPAEQTAARAFSRLVKLYISHYSEIKRAQGCIDFSDCENMLLDALRSDESFRRQLSERFSCFIVDEFQDSNDVQAEIFRLLGGSRLFFVGDVKQSIYAFRGGNPMIMARLCDGGDGFTQYPLHRNFRSRRQIIDVVNAAFGELMTREYGGVDYKNGNALEYGGVYPDIPEDEEKSYDAEIYALSFSGKDEMQNARFVANLIKKYADDENFFITKNGRRVRPSYSDFTILMRNNSAMKKYRDALSELSIPASVSKSRSFLFSEEIQLMINLLKIIDNPLLDEETLNVLMSPLYRFTAEETAQLKLGVLGFGSGELTDDEVKIFSSVTRKYSLFGCLNFCTRAIGQGYAFSKSAAVKRAEDAENELSERGISRKISAKAANFLRDMNDFRRFIGNNSADTLIRRIYDDTDILAVVSTYDDSRQRVSNLRRLETIASDFVERECGTLGDFLRFLDKSISNKRDIEEAASPESAANSVRIMTFHASKGLETPICILAELDTKMNTADSSRSFQTDHDGFFAMDYVDRENRFREKTFSSQALRLINRKKPIGEELRLLYVAMTRAMEKLIMVGSFSKKSIDEMLSEDFVPEDVFERVSPFSWILCALGGYFDGGCDNCKTSGTLPIKLFREENAPEKPEPSADGDAEFEVCESEIQALCDIISTPYKNPDETHRQAKFSVTELAHSGTSLPFTLTKPAFALSGGKSGADVGNAYHHCMESISFDAVRNSAEKDLTDCISAELYRLCDCGKITEDELEVIDAGKIAGFFGSSLGKKMLRSPKIEREFPFYAEIDGSKIDGKLSGIIGIQGRIDLFFEENCEIIVVDYKTDYDLEKEKDAYSKQVKIYAEVLPMLLGKNVSKTYLYSFSKGKEVEI